MNTAKEFLKVSNTYHKMHSKFTKQLKEITPRQYQLMYVIDSYPDSTYGKIADVLSVTPAQINALLKGLEAKKIVKARADKYDKRSKRLNLTKKGENILYEAGRES